MNGCLEAILTLKYVQNVNLLTGIDRKREEMNQNNLIKNLDSLTASSIDLNASNYLAHNYLDLVKIPEEQTRIDRVIEIESMPVAYVIDESELSKPLLTNVQIQRAREILACRSEPVFLIKHGISEITFYSVTLENSSKGMEVPSADGIAMLIDLLSGESDSDLRKYLFGSPRKKHEFLHDRLFKVLSFVSKGLDNTLALRGNHEVTLSLIGRALFTRFLIDRGIITEDTFSELYRLTNGQPKKAFSSPETCRFINEWLDSTFNGDLLPLNTNDYSNFFEKSIEQSIFDTLAYILEDIEASGQVILPGFVDFSYVPVGILSEVYEQFIHSNIDKEVQQKGKSNSVHYTPYHISRYMVETSFSEIKTSEPFLAKVLDPSCGGGVFLITVFRKLINEYWKKTGQQPDTHKIRDILYEQVIGFDISKEALNLAALGLYLSALELDPEPLPTSKLKFKKNLLGNVLIHTPSVSSDLVLGSLGDDIGSNYDGKFDLVIGNPPWTGLKKKYDLSLSKIIKEIAGRRGMHEIANNHNNPDAVPDLPFLWKSMEWAKEGGSITFALHARFLFKNSSIGKQSRIALFESLNVTGILNGSALRNTRAWPNITAPFCLLFAKNSIPSTDSLFAYVSPYFEQSYKASSRIKVDHEITHTISHSAIRRYPFLLKTLYRGNVLDSNVIGKVHDLLENKKLIKISDFWKKCIKPNTSGVGFQRTSKPKKDASFLIDRKARLLDKDFAKNNQIGFFIEGSELPPFHEKLLHRTRAPELYNVPLVLVNKAIGSVVDSKGEWVISSRISLNGDPIAFSESFYGFSTSTYSSSKVENEFLAKYLFLLFNSYLFLYYVLMTSSQFGVEREVIHFEDVENFPIISPKEMPSEIKKEIEDVYSNIEKNSQQLDSLNELVFKLYKLRKNDIEIIKDGIEVGLPTSGSVRAAQDVVTYDQKIDFFNMIKKMLAPYKVHVSEITQKLESWIVFEITSQVSVVNQPNDLFDISKMDDKSLLVFEVNNSLVIAVKSSYRYLTKTQGKILGLKLLEDHADFLHEHFTFGE